MPHYAIHCIDKPHAADLRAETRAAHLEHVRSVAERVVAGGPLLNEEGGPIGSLLIVDFVDRREAVGFAAADPYALAGLFASVAVTPWRQVFPEAS
ncbi:MAG: YciI family protein [Pseudomonadota bacterium]